MRPLVGLALDLGKERDAGHRTEGTDGDQARNQLGEAPHEPQDKLAADDD